MKLTNKLLIIGAIVMFLFVGCNNKPKNYSKEPIIIVINDAQKGKASAQNELGDRYFTGEGVEKDYGEAFKWHRKAAEQGHAEAQCRMGEGYFYGYGVEQNYREALKWYEKAAEQRNKNAQFMLGRCYEKGYGVRPNIVKAFKWYRKAADQGDKLAKGALKDLGYDK